MLQYFHMLLKYIRGYIYLRSLTKSNNITYILNNQHVGDLCYALSLLEEFKTKTNRPIKVIWSGKFKEVYTAFDIYDLVLLDEMSQNDISTYLQKSKSRYVKRIKDNQQIVSTFTNQYISSVDQEKMGISVLEVIAKNAYKISDNFTLKYPKRNMSSIDFSNIAQKGKTVFINPIAQSMEIPRQFFQDIADLLRNKGYTIITNLCSDNDKPLVGSKGIRLNLSDSFQLAEYCGFSIGIRSGFYDYVISANCTFYIVYSEDYPMKKCYSLTAWRTQNTVEEFVYTKTDHNNLVKSIIAKFDVD